MRKLFIHYPLFRLLSPIGTGLLVYLLILLVNNNVEQLQANFLGQEVYVCMALALVIQEVSRASLLIFASLDNRLRDMYIILLQFVSTMLVSIAIVTFVMKWYFKNFLGYTPNLTELLIFNAIFGFIALIYLLLYKGHQLLYKINKKKLDKEELEISKLNTDFSSYTERINSDLFFESLEALIVLMKKDTRLAEAFTEEFSLLYRYTLLKKNIEVVSIFEELEIVKNLLKIYSYLPYRKLCLKLEGILETLVVPGSLLLIFEKIIRTTLLDRSNELEVLVECSSDHVLISYLRSERLARPFLVEEIQTVIDKYSFYSDRAVSIENDGPFKNIRLPKLILDESNHN